MPEELHENLPAVPETAVEEMVFDGEVVDESAAAAYPGAAAAPAVRAVISHPVARVAGRHGLYVAMGAVDLVRRWHLKRTRFERLLRGAEAAGNAELIVALSKQQDAERQNRHDRRVETVRAVVELAKVSPVIGIVLLILMVLTGISMAVARHRFADIAWPWLALFHAIALAVEVVTVAWTVAVIAVPLGVLAMLWHLGRTASGLPGWAATSADSDVDVAIDERAVTQALAALRIPQIKDYLATGAPMPYLVACRQEGRGTYFEVRLPLGLPASEIAKPARRAKLAAGLYRKTTEVWPSVGADESVLRGWVADKGALDEGAGPYPLLGEGFTDVFKGFPFGKSLRGDPVKIPFMGRNTMCGGMPEQGKSNGARVMAAGATLDIIVELRLYIPDTNFDFERFKPRCARYVMGAEDEFIEQIKGDLEELKEELQMRGQLLIDAEQEEVTYALAHAGIGLHPVFVLLEEAHVAIQHRKYGKEITQLLCDIVKLDRKRGVHLMLSTQAPTADSMPRDVTRNCANGIAYAVGDHVANDALLGQGAYRGGHRATELIPGADRGTALCKGFSSEARSEMVQAYRVSGRIDDDQVTPIVKRAMAEMARKGRALPGSGRPLAIEARDLLTDLAEVIEGPDRVRLADLPARLRKLAPRFGLYKNMTRLDLKAELDHRDVRTTNTGNVLELSPADLNTALARRDEESE